jgi:hypothetical protein
MLPLRTPLASRPITLYRLREGHSSPCHARSSGLFVHFFNFRLAAEALMPPSVLACGKVPRPSPPSNVNVIP